MPWLVTGQGNGIGGISPQMRSPPQLPILLVIHQTQQIPPYPSDLNYSNISQLGFRLTGTDTHKFDRDKDGVGCEW
ncbi:excalibur calcium-binding domain-containing protein [Laspinema olomoucense]|uniref:excalibur calcium-binding domain-containing protein n=1 Tax=Laspinema olomoucense TaxID=3231600 RepID=UPI0021BA51F4|nr:excalibur calcium-binding domain-containing protein [Laspinema sp. D3d]MCT7971232.1 excalibur calcium-binding domain-containing protein [Laspinema sp. D3d]